MIGAWIEREGVIICYVVRASWTEMCNFDLETRVLNEWAVCGKSGMLKLLWSFDLYFVHNYSGYSVTLHTNTITVNVMFYSLLKVGFVLTFGRRCTRLQLISCFINYTFSSRQQFYKIQLVLSEVYKYKKTYVIYKTFILFYLH